MIYRFGMPCKMSADMCSPLKRLIDGPAHTYNLVSQAIFSGRHCSEPTIKKPLCERTIDLLSGEVRLTIGVKRSLPYSIWRETNLLLTESGFKWNTKEKYWAATSTSDSLSVAEQAEKNLLESEPHHSEINEKAREEADQRWADAEKRYLKEYHPNAVKKLEETVQNSPLTFVEPHEKESFLLKILDQAREILPSGINKERYVQVMRETIAGMDAFFEYDPLSIQEAVLTAAALGLEPSTISREGYFIPINKKIHFIIGYRGLMELSMRTGENCFIDARCVREKDRLEVLKEPYFFIAHVPCEKQDKGKIQSVYAILAKKDTSLTGVVMSSEEVLKFAKNSKANKISGHSPWRLWEEEMLMKSVVKHLLKKGELGIEKRPENYYSHPHKFR